MRNAHLLYSSYYAIDCISLYIKKYVSGWSGIWSLTHLGSDAVPRGLRIYVQGHKEEGCSRIQGAQAQNRVCRPVVAREITNSRMKSPRAVLAELPDVHHQHQHQHYHRSGANNMAKEGSRTGISNIYLDR